MANEWYEELLRCAEGMYVIKEESKEIVWVNRFFMDALKTPCVGEPCWKVLLRRETPCPFCPRLSEQDGVYAWDYYEPNSKRWMKVKHLVFRRDSVLYRAGNINMIDDVMHLNYETVQEISMLQTVLAKNRDEMTSLTKEAIYDALTGLLNRNCFKMDMEREYVNVPGLGILYFDLNNLKATNDKYRHAVGDVLLRRLADVLRLVCAQAEHAKCYRVGGDEFVLMLSRSTKETLKRCVQIFDGYMDNYNRNQTYFCSVAMGQAFSQDPCDPELLVSKADDDMYCCKQKMKEQIQERFL